MKATFFCYRFNSFIHLILYLQLSQVRRMPLRHKIKIKFNPARICCFRVVLCLPLFYIKGHKKCTQNGAWFTFAVYLSS